MPVYTSPAIIRACGDPFEKPAGYRAVLVAKSFHPAVYLEKRRFLCNQS
jgi:hypothetical protein